jgi:hypothetical protein
MPSTKTNYRLDDSGDFTITNYNSSKLFSSFFPGLAGKNGIPMWTFYVNRGQCICSMGIEGKHHPIMEFLPANWAYNLVSTQGFRTFVKIYSGSSHTFYEPFQDKYQDEYLQKTQSMIISPAKLTLEEVNHSLGIIFRVEYFNAPQDEYAGLIRKLSIQNLNSQTIKLEVLDGLPLIIPYGLDDFGLKHMRRLFEAFVEVTNHKHNVPFFKLKVEPADRPDVVRITKGNFYLGFLSDGKLVSPIYDPARIFGIRGDYSHPEKFLSEPLQELILKQNYENRLPCAMGAFSLEIPANESRTYSSVIGHAASENLLNAMVPRITQSSYITHKESENREIVSALTQKNFICSSEPALDHYARQNFLDNVLRGGFPHTIRGKNSATTLHLYSRKHGDLERDYNDYRLTPTPYSQGNGNYRDVNQNRRCDLFFNPDVREGNLLQFFNLIQLDGFNPLVIKEIRFSCPEASKLDEILAENLGAEHTERVKEYLSAPFTPGELLMWLKAQNIAISQDVNIFIGDLLGVSDKKYETGYGEGFWVDHWFYNLDLLENYLALYPEQLAHILFEDQAFSFYDNPHHVQSRDDTYVIWEGKPMQLDSVAYDEDKEALIKARDRDKNKVRKNFGKGDVYYTNLFVKMLSIIVNKLASLDAEGVGIEMEAGKPGWYDALNGLPGLFGSSISESLETARHIKYLLKVIAAAGKQNSEVLVYTELKDFITALHPLLRDNLSTFDYWDRSNAAKERYREITRLGVSGNEQILSLSMITDFLRSALAKLEIGISKAKAQKDGVISTYFINEVVDHEEIKLTDAKGKQVPKLNLRGLPCFRAKAFKHKALPLFLEGPVHYLHNSPSPEDAMKLSADVRKSGLFDHKLMMYKVNESIADQPMEIGRARTFSPGWFENESIWLHMEYKYMLELLRNELYTDFYRDFKNVFIPFQNPDIYGRSILENSSFIVSSNNPDPSLHGNGFVARLSGATAEFINILHMMAVGKELFSLSADGVLQLKFSPALPAWLFTKSASKARLLIQDEWQDLSFAANTFSFMFLGEILVSFHNPQGKDTFGPNAATVAAWTLTDLEGKTYTVQGAVLQGHLAEKVRNREISRIKIELKG